MSVGFFFQILLEKQSKVTIISVLNAAVSPTALSAAARVAYLRPLKPPTLSLKKPPNSAPLGSHFARSFSFVYLVFLLLPIRSLYYRNCNDLMFDHLQPQAPVFSPYFHTSEVRGLIPQLVTESFAKVDFPSLQKYPLPPRRWIFISGKDLSLCHRTLSKQIYFSTSFSNTFRVLETTANFSQVFHSSHDLC